MANGDKPPGWKEGDPEPQHPEHPGKPEQPKQPAEPKKAA